MNRRNPKRIMHFPVIPEATATLSELKRGWKFILVKDNGGGYASVRSSFLCSGEREVGNVEW